MLNRIIYKCKKCGWNRSITAAWADISPKKCCGRNCKTSFRLNPELLEIIKVEEKVQEQTEEPKLKKKK